MQTSMNPDQAGAFQFALESGTLEVLINPATSHRSGLAILLHPQPLMGGSARHKVLEYLARALSAAGWTAVRPNFRGVGGSSGIHDAGRGESADIIALVQLLRREHPADRVCLMGFSFGAFVAASVAHRLEVDGAPPWRTCLAGMPYGAVAGGRIYDTPRPLSNVLVIHGEKDQQVPLERAFDWARADVQPVLVIPGADHFFSGRLPLLARQVIHHFQGD